MSERLDIAKTYKLYIGGKFPRTESGRSVKVEHDGKVLAHVCRGSRKDLRNAVEAAHKAQPAWADATAYLRSQILYRIGEMMEGKKRELAEAIDALPNAGHDRGGLAEVECAIDRVVHFAGWADKLGMVFGSHNAVAGPYYNFTAPEPTGVVVIVAPREAPVLGLISLLAPVIVCGNTAVAIASDAESGNPIPASILGEVFATSDVPGGVVNLITGLVDELAPHIASHREIDAVLAANTDDATRKILEQGAAENLKRVRVREVADFFDDEANEGPWLIEPFMEMKTVWHPSAT